MFSRALLSVGTLIGLLAPSVAALGSSFTAPLTKGSAGANDPFWLQNIAHQGLAPFSANPSTYKVFRNVKVYGNFCNASTRLTDSFFV